MRRSRPPPKLDIGKHADADDDQIDQDMPASLRLTPVGLAPSASMPATWTPRWRPMPAAWPACEELSIFPRSPARHHARGELDDVDLEPLCARGGCEFEAMKPAPITTTPRPGTSRCRTPRFRPTSANMHRIEIALEISSRWLRAPVGAPDARNERRAGGEWACARRGRTSRRYRRSNRSFDRNENLSAGTSGCPVSRSPSDRLSTKAAAIRQMPRRHQRVGSANPS